MMNMIELQDKLKNFSQDQLVSMMQQPTGEAPQFMVLSEITRRQKMQKEAESQQAPTQSVAQEAVTAAGVPQGGIADMARSLAPQTNVAQNTGVNPAAPPQGMPMPSAPQGPAPMAAAPQGIAKMASGGVIKMQAAGRVGFIPMEQLGKLLTADPEDRPKRKLIATVPVGRRGDLVNVYDDYTFINVDENGNEGWLVTSPTESNAVFDALGIPAEERLVKQYDRGENHTGYTPLEGYVPPEQRTAPAAESAPTGLGAYAAPTMDAPVSDSAPSTPVFDATVEVPTAPQMPVPPKTDSMPQGPRPSTTGGTQVNIAGNIYAVLGDGSVVDQMGRTPPPPVAELARQKAGTPAAQFTTQQQYQDAQNLANRIGANSGENAVLPSENLLMGGGREGTPYLSTPAADTAIYAGGYDPRTNVPSAPSGLAALSQETMPTVGGPAAPPPPPPAPPAPPAPSLEEVMDQFAVNRTDAQAIIDRTYTPRINGEGSPFAVNENAPTGTRDAYSMILPPLPAPFFNSEVTAAEKRAVYEKEKARREKETAAFAAAETPPSVPLEKSDLAAELTGAIKPKARPEDLFTTTKEKNDATAELLGATTGTGSGTGSGGMSDYETELMKIMKSREKAAESDKWLALAQVGMGLMQGGSGSFLGDVGAAGMKGLETLRTSRDQADTDKLSLLKAREDARIDRARIAASAAKGSAYDVNDYVKLLADLATQKQTIMADLSTTSAEKELAIKDITIEEARIRALMFPGRASSTPKPQTLDATKPLGLIGRGINAVSSFVTG
jgi:hypothetical protein